MACLIEVEDRFGPGVASTCHQGFDFTLLFEEVILCIVPLLVVLSLVPIRLQYLSKRSDKFRGGWLHRVKLAHYIALLGLQLAQLGLFIQTNVPKTRASVALAALSVPSTELLGFLSHLEHRRSVRPSALLNVYYAFSAVLDAARTRTLWAIEGSRTIAILSLLAVLVKFFIALLESRNRLGLLRPTDVRPSREASGGVFDRALFWWLNPLLIIGYKKILQVDQLEKIDEGLVSDDLRSSMQIKWDNWNQRESNALLKALFSEYKYSLLLGIVPRLCQTGFTFAQPFLVARTVEYISEPDSLNEKNIGYGLIGATAIIYAGLALATTNYQHKTYRTITLFRGSLVSLIYQKTLSISVNAFDPTSSVTLMSADVERVGQGMRFMHETWGSLVDIGLGLWLLQRQLGVSSVAPAALFLICTLTALKIATGIGHAQRAWLEKTQARVSATSNMLGSMKGVKMSGLTAESHMITEELRADELKASLKFKHLLVVIVALSYVTTALAPVIAFATFVLKAKATGSETLNIENAFTSLTLFALLRRPMTLLIESVSGLSSTMASLERIRRYLISDSRQEPMEPTDEEEMDQNEKNRGHDLAKRPAMNNMTETGLMAERTESCINVADLSAGWESSGELVLKSLNFHICRGQTTMIVGPVACGKSTLLKALLGETPELEGSIVPSFSNSAFCSQTPWLTNDTIRDNILGVDLYHKEWYETVVHACDLAKDFFNLAKGDQTIIGSQGASLSGGQQARVALARAIYARKRIVLLDDILSGLDPETEEHLFVELFGPKGLFAEEGTTVIMATNAIHRMPSADYIIVLGKNGTLVEQGTFDYLISTPGYVQSLDSRKGKSTGEKKKAEEVSNGPALPAPPVQPPPPPGNRRKGSLKTYGFFVSMIGWFNTIFFLLLSSGFVFGLVFPQVWVQWWATYNQNHPNQRVAYYVGVYAGLGIAAIIFLVLAAWHLLVNIVPHSSTKSHSALLNTVLKAPLSFFGNNDVGTIANRFAQDLQLIDMEVPLAIFNTMMEFLTCVAQAILIASTTKYIAPAIPACLLVFWIIQKFYLRTSRQLRLLEIEAKSPLFTKFLEALGGLSTIRAFKWEAEFERRFSLHLDVSQKPYYLLYCVQRWLNLVLEMTVAVLAVILTAVAVFTKGKISPGLIGISLVNIVGFSSSVKSLMTNWTILETSIGSVQRVKEFVEETTAEEEDLTGILDPPSEWPEFGRIEIKNLTACHKPSKKPVLSDVSVTIEAGEKVAICGRTGSGKSSLISTLLRILDLDSGNITVDHIDLASVPRETVRSRLITLPQQAYLIHGTIRYNVDPWGRSSDHQIIEVLAAVGLVELVLAKGGLDATLGDDALSHGQKQLMCLARAMLRDSSILILDEATSSVDTETDKLMQRIIREHFDRHTIIAVVHRLETILDFDKIVFLDAGKIIEIGSPLELLSRPSAFREAYEILKGEGRSGGEGSSVGLAQ